MSRAEPSSKRGLLDRGMHYCYCWGIMRNLNKFKMILVYSLIGIGFVGSMIFVNVNHSLYERPIAKIVDMQIDEVKKVTDMHGNEDQLSRQHLVGEIKNGEKKGEILQLTNQYSASNAYDQKYDIGNEVFVLIDSPREGEELQGVIEDVKRDRHMMFVVWAFIFVLLLVGRKQGFYSIISLVLNALILSYALDIYISHAKVNLLFICGICVVLFTVTSLLLVNGFNEKSYAAIMATLLGTLSALLIAYLVIQQTDGNGLHYEEMQYLTRPYEVVFMAGLFIGSLGAVMDVAITMSSSVFELYEKDPHISLQALKDSALDIGKDIMGTMTNILFFAYISGSIPVLLLYLKNTTSLPYAFSINLSLELARALAGGIGIVLTIPIGLYTSIFFLNRKKVKL